VPERIGQHRDPAIRRIARRHFQDRAGAQRAFNGSINIISTSTSR